MGKPKFRLSTKKNVGSPAYLKRVNERNMKRLVQNASVTYGCNPSHLLSAVVKLPLLNIDPNCNYQQHMADSQCSILKRPVVVSLFDGISAGLVALQSLGINPDKYFSSEIDEHALRVQRFHYGDEIIFLGDIRDVDSAKLKSMKVLPDLLMGGSPCAHLSRVNPNRLGLHDDNGTGPLFFHFLRVMLYFKFQSQLCSREKEFFWFFENTSNIDKETCSTISKFLGCEPIKLCSSMFVGMRRSRFFWTNIPMSKENVEALHSSRKSSDVPQLLQNFLCGSGRTANIAVLPTFTSNLTNLVKGGLFPVCDAMSGHGHPYYSEIEKLFGFPLHYTAGPNTPLHIRKNLLARTWDVHTIQFLLKPLIDVWKC